MNTQIARTGPVVLGLDERPAEEQLAAVRFAAAEANRRRVALVLAHGCRPLVTATSFEPTDPPVDRERRGMELLAGAGKVVRHHLDAARPLEVRLGQGSGVDLLLELSASASLIVLQRRSIGALRRWHTGSTTSRVAAEAECPVVVLRDDHEEQLAGSGVVVGVDERGHAGLAVEAAFAEAALRRSTLTAVHAWRTPDLALTYGYLAAEPSAVDELEQQAEIELAEALAGFGEQHPDVVVRRAVVSGAPAAVLDAVGRTAELMVIGRHGTGRSASLALGGVARHCIAAGPCPVMVVPGAGAERQRPHWLTAEVAVGSGF
ncbi:universal stress protein [Microlunatus ginsengisoli]|uniref:Universal stress protein n=1 Tax=Microlunatus ginsengisoli TaxID=363863 RepID=A0ABP7ARN3_9ACTN